MKLEKFILSGVDTSALKKKLLSTASFVLLGVSTFMAYAPGNSHFIGDMVYNLQDEVNLEYKMGGDSEHKKYKESYDSIL